MYVNITGIPQSPLLIRPMSSEPTHKISDLYTEWANRCLSRAQTSTEPSPVPIKDLQNELRDYRRIVALIKAALDADPRIPQLYSSLTSVKNNIDGIGACLRFLQQLGVDVSKVSAKEVDAGHLTSVLQLVYALSNQRQQQRVQRKELEKKMAPASRLQQPTRLATPLASASPVNTKLSTPTGLARLSSIRPPTSSSTNTIASTGLKPPSKLTAKLTSGPPSRNNNGSLISSACSSSVEECAPSTSLVKKTSTLSTSTTTSTVNTTTTSSTNTPSATRLPSQTAISATKQQILQPNSVKSSPVKTSLRPPAAISATRKIAPKKSTASESAMPKLTPKTDSRPPSSRDRSPKQGTIGKGLKEQQARPPAPASAPQTSTPKSRTGLRPPSARKTTVIMRESLPSSQISTADSSKRASRSSEEDSAYAGFGSVSPGSSTSPSSSMSARSDTRSDNGKDHGTQSETRITKIMLPASRISEQEKPMLAVKGIAVPKSMRLISETAPATTTQEHAAPPAPAPCPLPQKTSLSSPTVGIVSPMLSQRKLDQGKSQTVEASELKEQKVAIKEPSPAPSNGFGKIRPTVPTRTTSRLEAAYESRDRSYSRGSSVEAIPAMVPIRHPPTYDQLIAQGKIPSARAYGRIDSSTSEDFLDSVSTAVRCDVPLPSGYFSDCDQDATSQKGLSCASESGISAYERMQARLFECRNDARRSAYLDSFEDSSSVSSGVSDCVDDSPTRGDPMAAAASYGSIRDYGQFIRAANGRSSSSSLECRQRRLIEQHNVQQLLKQCRTSQRGAARDSQQTGVPLLSLSADGETLSVRTGSAQGSGRRQDRQGGPQPGFHSLDRKCLTGDLRVHSRRDASTSPHRLSLLEQRSAMALVSPRRSPMTMSPHYSNSPAMNGQQQNLKHQQHPQQLNASGMSRSMVLLDAMATPRPHRRGNSPRRPRLPLSIASAANSPAKGSHYQESIYGTPRDNSLQLRRLTDHTNGSPAHSTINGGGDDYGIYGKGSSPGTDTHGSMLSLASSSAYNTLADKYESELKKMNSDLEGYRQTVSRLTRRQEEHTNLLDTFDKRLLMLGRHMEKAQLKPEELKKLRQEIENLRNLSTRAAQEGLKIAAEGAGELLRPPSLESVASHTSHRSSMSSSSKSSKTDKSSVSSFGKTKRSWVPGVDNQIRSSFSKAFGRRKKGTMSDTESSPMHCGLDPIAGSTSRLNSSEPVSAVVELKKQLEDRNFELVDYRLETLSKAREVDILRETINKLKNENKQLRQGMNRILARSRASSQSSLQMGDEEPVYETPPNEGTYSKRSSGNAVKVSVNVDFVGCIRTAICPEHEISIGYLPLPSRDTAWEHIDAQITELFDEYISRIDPDRHLGLHCQDSVIGYQIGEIVRERLAKPPVSQPCDVISIATTIRIFLRGAKQQSVDSLVLESLFPRSMLDLLLKHLMAHRRLILTGATGIGKSGLARQLAAYASLRIGQQQDSVVDIKIPDDDNNKTLVKIEKELESEFRKTQRVILIDNIPRHRIAFLSSVFESANVDNDKGPYVICTVNRAFQLPELQMKHNFKVLMLNNRMEGVKGFMGRFLRRRMLETEFRLRKQLSPQVLRIIAFLPTVLHAINTFIEKANSLDVTIGPRLFTQCPLDVDESRTWFVNLWNEKIIPYMRRVATEGVKVLGRCGSFEDPTDTVCENWPWEGGPSGEQLLKRLELKELASQRSNQAFNPLDTLFRLQASKHAVLQENM